MEHSPAHPAWTGRTRHFFMGSARQDPVSPSGLPEHDGAVIMSPQRSHEPDAARLLAIRDPFHLLCRFGLPEFFLSNLSFSSEIELICIKNLYINFIFWNNFIHLTIV